MSEADEAAIEEVQGWAAGLGALHAQIAGRFARAEPRRRVLAYLRGLLGNVGRKNGWQLAEHAGERTPDGMHRRRSRMSDFGWGLVLLGTYVVLVVLARWIYIARPNIVWTSVQAGAMAKRLSFQVEQRPWSNGKGSLSPAALQRAVDELK